MGELLCKCQSLRLPMPLCHCTGHLPAQLGRVDTNSQPCMIGLLWAWTKATKALTQNTTMKIVKRILTQAMAAVVWNLFGGMLDGYSSFTNKEIVIFTSNSRFSRYQLARDGEHWRKHFRWDEFQLQVQYAMQKLPGPNIVHVRTWYVYVNDGICTWKYGTKL